MLASTENVLFILRVNILGIVSEIWRYVFWCLEAHAVTPYRVYVLLLDVEFFDYHVSAYRYSVS
jgi:hypothetical protein